MVNLFSSWHRRVASLFFVFSSFPLLPNSGSQKKLCVSAPSPTPSPPPPHPLGLWESTTHQHFWVFQNQTPEIPSTSFSAQVEVEYFSLHQGNVRVYLSRHDWSKPRQILKHLLHCSKYLGCLMKLTFLRCLLVWTEILQRNKRSCLPWKELEQWPFKGVVACIAWWFWLGMLSNIGGQGQRNYDGIRLLKWFQRKNILQTEPWMNVLCCSFNTLETKTSAILRLK